MRTTWLVLLMLAFCSAARAQVAVKLMEGFELDGAADRWELHSAKLELTSKHATEGRSAAKFTFDQVFERENRPVIKLKLGRNVFPQRDWMGYGKLVLDLYNGASREVKVYVWLADTSGARLSRAEFDLPAARATPCTLSVAKLYQKVHPEYGMRGQKQKPDEVVTPVLHIRPHHPNQGDVLVVDNIRLEAEPLQIEKTFLVHDPFGGGNVRVFCKLNRAARLDLSILDWAGKWVSRAEAEGLELDWTWDDCTELATVSPGAYKAVLKITDVKHAPGKPIVRQLGSFQITTEDKRTDVVAWQHPTTAKVMLGDRPGPDSPLWSWKEIKAGSANTARPIRLHMARNEYEGAQVVFLARERPVRFSFTVEGLRHVKTSEPFPLEGSEILQVGYLKTENPQYYEVDHIGWWPDALMPVEQMFAEPGECMPVWIILKSGQDTKPGTYKGKLAVKANGQASGSIPLEVRVYDIKLPVQTSLRNVFTFFDRLAREIHHDNPPPGMMRRYQQFLSDHRLNIDNLYRSEPPSIDDLEYFDRKGQLNAFNIKYIGGKIDPEDPAKYDEYLRKLAEELDPYVAQLRKRGLAKKAYIYGFDEVRPETFATIKKAFGFLKKRYPEIPTMTTGVDPRYGMDTGLDDVVDIWVPLTPSYKVEEARKVRARGKDVWWYICIGPPHPYANWFVEYPAIEARLLWWMTYQYEVPGFLYYATNLRHHQNELMRLDGHNKKDWIPASWRTANGDGCFIYSGPEGPISTIRMENIRDGIEDTELLYLLEKKLRDGGKAGRAACGELIESLTKYTRDPGKFAKVRLRLLERLEKGR